MSATLKEDALPQSHGGRKSVIKLKNLIQWYWNFCQAGGLVLICKDSIHSESIYVSVYVFVSE